jgi:FixJ family two-component response regulator
MTNDVRTPGITPLAQRLLDTSPDALLTITEDGRVAASAVTGRNAAGIEDDAMRSGCAGFVQKPIDFDKLLRILSASLAE